MIKAQLERLSRHAYWANRTLLDALEAGGCPEALPLLAHAVAAEEVWLARLREKDATDVPIWPDDGLATVRRRVEEGRREWAAFFKQLGQSELLRRMEYRDSQGTEFHNSMADMLTHLAMHGSHHRGQVVREIRRAGAEPPNVDYMTWVRLGEPE